MLTKTLAATAALSMLVGGGSALAQSKSSATAGPKQPIPYSQLNAYMKASPKVRASKDWWSGSASASTGMSTDTSATTSGSTTDTTSSSSTMSGSSMTPSTSTDTSVNPPTSSGSTSMPSTPPTDGGTQSNGSTLPNAATPGDATGSSTTSTPTEPK